MKLIALIVCALCLFSTPVGAQQSGQPFSPGSDQPLPENYVLTLTVSSAEQATMELSLNVASTSFKTDFPDSRFTVGTFAGTLIPEEGGTILIRYMLVRQIAVSTPGTHDSTVQYKNVSTQASVRLRPGESVQLLKAGTEMGTLSIARLSEQQAKGK